jgi:transposase
MGSAVELTTDYSATALCRLSRTCGTVNQTRRLLALAGVLNGMNCTDAARRGSMDRQTLRDWVHRFNQTGPDGLQDAWHERPRSPTRRPWCRSLAPSGYPKVIQERFDIDYHERTIGKLLKELGFSPAISRPRHPGQDARV